MKKIPILNKDKQKEVWIKVRKIDPDFKLDEEHHRHAYEELIWINSGTGTQLIDNETIEIEGETLYLISNGQVHNFLEGQALDGYVIVFDSNYLRTNAPFHLYLLTNLLKNIKDFNIIKFNALTKDEFDLVVRQMLNEYNKLDNEFGKNSLLIYYLLILLTQINRHIQLVRPVIKSTAQDYKFAIYNQFLQLIDLNFTNHHDLSFYAKSLGVSTRNLTNYTNLYSGKSAKQLLTNRIITEAKRLLIYTPQSLAEISGVLGFDDTSYFIRLFKRKTKFTPRQFREEQMKL